MSEESSSSRAANRVLVRTVATLAAITSSYTTTAQTSPPLSLCSCSPTKFNFQLNFQGNCDSSSLTGVSDELCFINVRPSDSVVDIEAILSKVFASETRSKKEDFWRRLSHDDDTSNEHSNNQNQRVLNSVIPTRVTNVEIFEYDTTDVLNIINQETFSNQSLSDGDIIEFTSISSQLDPNKPLQDQLQYFPGGLILKYVGVNSNNEHVRNTISWNYSIEDCTTEQISVGDFIGWTIVEDVILANGAFCPATITPPPTLSPTTTAKPVTPTIDPSIILRLSPTNNPTITAKPVTPTNNPTITAKPVTPTSSPTITAKPVIPTISPTLTAKPVTQTSSPTITAKPVTQTNNPTITGKPVTPTSSPTITAKPVSPTIGPTTSAKPVTAKPVTEKPVTAKPVTATISPSIIIPSPPTIGPTIAEPVTAKPVTEKPVTAKPVTGKTSEPTTPSKASKFLASKSKAGKVLPSKADKVSHSPIHDWSGGHHKPTPSPVYDWKDKPTASPIYDWTDKDPTKMPTPTPIGVKPPSPAPSAGTGWGGDGWDQGKPKPTGDKPTQEGSLIIGIVPSKSPSQDVPTQDDTATKMPVLDWVFTKSPIYNAAPLEGSRTIGLTPSKRPAQVVSTRDGTETKMPVLDWVFTKSPIYNTAPSNKPTPTTSAIKTEWSGDGGKHDTKSNKEQGTKSDAWLLDQVK